MTSITTSSGEVTPAEIERQLTERQLQVLQYLLKKAVPLKVYTVYADQDELARELGMTRQALSVHLKKLKDFGLIRTGREFVDVTDKALRVLRMSSNEAVILVKVQPRYRTIIYEKVKELPIEKAYRVSGDYDLILITREVNVNDILRVLSLMEGIEDTKTFISLETLRE
ncbi:Lrp/AsnC ligand binding domain-containing protein [Vulcanisaeta souniana]|uniref:AsnC family transcriptional regulator n=1 Tax=Vulcanisaeta souniana JCM 11219 TaxID=1293586 RepID=A0A830E007_9CREN|nr:Lrp/AsnC ligand binding domain-containing protein [Vulcanisaeta souniana]BDR91945.1 AsnC family transcriptional regulator [Vulcanisaeta souniana JCM 11219]GGI69141.1 AsnC family transcriptional regulator [Vulcanisaeta souniana JCM 11219]